MRDVLRSFILLSPLAFVNLTLTLVQGKVLAVVLGPDGTGLYFLAISFSGLIVTLMGLGLSASLPKLVAEFREKHQVDIWLTVVVGIAMSSLLGLILVGVVVATDVTVARMLLGGDALSSSTITFVLVTGLAGAFPWSWALAFQGFLKGLRNLSGYVKAGSIAATALLACVLAGAVIGGARGAVVGTILGQLTNTIVFATAAIREAKAQELPITLSRVAIRMPALQKRLWYLGLGAVVALFASSLGQNVVRSYLANNLSLTALGFFAAAWALSNRIPSMIYQTFSAYTVPTISALAQDWRAVAREQNHALRLGLLLGTPIMCVTTILLPWLIPVMLSSSFLPSSQLIRLMLIGELLSIVAWATCLALYPTGRAGINALSEWIWWGVFIGAAIPLTATIGLKGIGCAYIAAYLTLSVAAFAWEWRHHRLLWTVGNLKLIATSLAAVLVASGLAAFSALPIVAQLLLTLATLASWALVSVTASERQEARTALNSVGTRVRAIVGRT
jgi:O-antigen/teichoic acid export membrane protein